MARKIITLRKTGEIEFIYDDSLRGLANHGDSTTKRASNVEPGDPAQGQDGSKWYADMKLSQGPILGPFDTRQQALDSEVEWLNEHVLC